MDLLSRARPRAAGKPGAVVICAARNGILPDLGAAPARPPEPVNDTFGTSSREKLYVQR
jgi:hypothetical protein